MKWSETEIETLESLYNSENASQLAEEFGRSSQAVKTKASELGLTENRIPEWTDEQISFLKNNYSKKPTRKIAEELGRTYEATRTKAINLDLKKEENYKVKNKLREKEIKNYKDTAKNNFLAGLAAGESTFTKNSRNPRPQYTFRILMAERDEKILKEFKETLKVGSINYFESDNEKHENTVRYGVNGIVDIVSSVIPFFEQIGFRGTYKNKQFKEWKEQLYKDYELETIINSKEGIRNPDFESEYEEE